jgi:taurine--2-oxoglutarate transaminase
LGGSVDPVRGTCLRAPLRRIPEACAVAAASARLASERRNAERSYHRRMATIESRAAEGQRIQQEAKQYVLHSWSVQNAINPLPVAGAEGRYFWDYEGKRYLDFASQLVNVSIGHQHPRLVAALKEQADKLCTIGPPMATEPRSTLARYLAEITPGDLSMAFFTNGGAEANENAIKVARWYTGRQKVIARYRSYHGATGGAITLTGDPRRWGAEPGMPGIVRMFDPYTYRCPAGHPDPCPVCTGAPHLEEILQYEGAHTVAAVILETVTGTNGLIVPPDGYLRSIRETCDRHGILLITDEVMAGFGRTGKWFGVDNWDVVPDIMTLAKGINSGYVPLGAMVVREPIAAWLRDKYFAGGLTYSGHPLACAVAVASIDAFKDEGIVENAARRGEDFREGLQALALKHPSIGEVRGLGCFWGLELVKSRETREPLVPYNGAGEDAAPVSRLARAAMERGLYLMTHWNVILICPPLTITREELDEGLAILDEALAIADEYVA